MSFTISHTPTLRDALGRRDVSAEIKARILSGQLGECAFHLDTDEYTTDADGLVTLTDQSGGVLDAAQPSGQTPLAPPAPDVELGGKSTLDFSPNGEVQYLQQVPGAFDGGDYTLYWALLTDIAGGIYRASEYGNLGLEVYSQDIRMGHTRADTQIAETNSGGNLNLSPMIGTARYDSAEGTLRVSVIRKPIHSNPNLYRMKYDAEGLVRVPSNDLTMRVMNEGGGNGDQNAARLRMLGMVRGVLDGEDYRLLRAMLVQDIGLPDFYLR